MDRADRSRLNAWVVGLSVAALAAGACSLDKARPPANCPDHVTIHVSADSIPVFTWDPPCAASGFDVSRPLVRAYEPVWDILSGTEAVSPPLKYGVSPFHEPDVVKPDTLIAGIDYRVSMYVFKGFTIVEVGETHFIYRP